MNILHFSWEYPPAIWGGLGTFALEITKKQAELGHQVTVFSVNKDNTLPVHYLSNDVSIYRPRTIELRDTFTLFSNKDISSWGTHFQFFSDVMNFNITSSYEFLRHIKTKDDVPVDVIDGHDWLGIIGAMATTKELSAPLLFHVHSTEHGRSLGHGSETIHHIEHEGAQRADGIITVSHAMKRELSSLGFPKDKIHVCWNAVDPNKYDPNRFSELEKSNLRQKYHINDDDIMLFFIGRLVEVKGPDKLIEAFSLLLEEFPYIKLVILGVGGMEEQLLSLQKPLGIEENCIIIPTFVSEEERILHYAASDIVIFPSLYEPFGIVCTEAMAMGKPVVVGASGINGMAEQVIPKGNHQCGYHVNPHKPEDIAWGIKQLLNRDDKGRQFGKNGRQRVLDEFTWDVITNKTIKIYEEFI